MRERIVPIALLSIVTSLVWAAPAQSGGERQAVATSANASGSRSTHASPPAPAAPPAPAPAPPPAPPPAPAPASGADDVFARALRAYHAALLARHLGRTELRREEVGARVAEAEQWMGSGRIDEAIARLAEVIEDPQFDLFADTEEGRAAVFRLGDALAAAGVFDPAREYLRRVVEARGAWDAGPSAQVWARRAVGRLVDIALETEQFEIVAEDLKHVPPGAPEQVRGEIAYMNGRAHEAAKNPDAALRAYGTVTQRCRFWAGATYLSALIQVEQGRYTEAENLLCKVADPKRSAATTPVFADEKFFAIRDLARLGLGRIAHEQGRNDDARYYYYLVPQDSDRLAEALYEAATTRYEKKDYDGARELLDQLAALGVHHRYEDEAWVLDAWVDLARCRFADADKKLVEFLKRYEPVRDGARRIAESNETTARLLAAAHSGTDAVGGEIGGVTPEVVQIIAALVRLDPAYDRVLRRRSVLEREASGLALSMAAVGDMQRALATNGGVRPTVELGLDDARRAQDAREAALGVEQAVADLEAAHAPADKTAPLRQDLATLKARLESEGAVSANGAQEGGASPGVDLPDLLRADSTQVTALQTRVAAARKDLYVAESALAKDALHRLDLRLSRLLRRASLGRIESVLGRKRALEVEVEAIRLGYLPQDAVDSLDAARYLEDNEEYWPFEGDDWPDEYVGAEIK
jgi:tetratricopeptide (TPR) repeat protein